MPRDLTALSTTTTAGLALDRRALGRLWRLAWPTGDGWLMRRLGITIALLLGAALLNALVPLLFARAVDRFVAAPEGLTVVPVGLLLAYVLLGWGGKLMNELRWALYGPIEQRLRRRLARRSLEHLHGLSLGFHLDRRTGQIGRVMDNGLSGLRELLFDAVFVILPLLAEILFVGVVLFWVLEPIFAGILLATILVYAVVLVVGSEWLRQHQRRAVRESSAAQGRAVDSLLNYETVKYFGNERHVAERYDQSLALVERLTVKALSLRAVTGIVLVTILALGTASILFLAAGRVGTGAMTVGAFVLVNSYLLQLTRPLDRLGQLYRSIKQAFVDLEQLLTVLEEVPEVVDRPHARPLEVRAAAVRFAHVGFAYRQDRALLAGIDFAMAPGAKVALVGPTGAGKSTVARLLFRFCDPTEGRILIDGQDIALVTQASLRDAIAVVPQDTVLFNETIGYNIAFGRPDAGEAEIEDAARAAELHDFVMRLPERYATMVGERGLKLSGGEKQRVAIARAILKRPRLFILDEATASLDSATERAIQASLDRLAAGVTTLVIAHRLSTVTDADLILVMDRGRIVERGRHGELLAEDGLYAALWAEQAGAEDGSRERVPASFHAVRPTP